MSVNGESLYQTRSFFYNSSSLENGNIPVAVLFAEELKVCT